MYGNQTRAFACGCWGFHCAKKVVSNSPGLADFAIGLSDFCSQLSRRASAVFWGNSNYKRIVINPANQKGF